MGRRSAMQLNWVFDEYFVKPDVWETVFRPAGIACRPVLKGRTERALETVVQLSMADETPIETEGLAYEDCPVCGRRKFGRVTRGPSPAPLATQGAMFRSREPFGSGAAADRLVFVAQPLFGAIEAAKLLGVEFRPCGDKENPVPFVPQGLVDPG
jgi:hypothetical protein